MPLCPEFFKEASDYFNPYLPSSGTEHMALLLYSLVRINRPKVVVEYGSGYSTLFVLRALADNIADVNNERAALIEKSKKLGDIKLPQNGLYSEELSAKLACWFDSGGIACGINPKFYINPYEPHLFSFEDLSGEHEYAKKMASAVEAIGHKNIFTHLAGQKFSVDALPLIDTFVDLAWNDSQDYKEFFSEFWPVLNPEGGLLIFHNTVGFEGNYEAIEWMKTQRFNTGENDLEILSLEEAHKLNQNGCTILRKTSKYRPPFHLSNIQKIHQNLVNFLRKL